ncbi:hypothetical protein [Vibrio cyclitrophicus]|uniref:hypothetical protein n=1 Tax=Vibrio cyclitrophicus TaxID=47951 RepID=UPI0032E43873
MGNTNPTDTSSPVEPSQQRRHATLRSVEANQMIHKTFAEKYGYIDDNGKANIQDALNYLDNTFFKSFIEKGRTITNYHRTQVITVSSETDLNPFNNEIYGIFTPFGDLKVTATMDGWLKLATNESITKREFNYSPDTVEVVINGNTYKVPEWIECTIEHETKGVSQAREYFSEVFDNGQNHLPSWSRPARMLSHVSFIQALRRMLRINSLADSDIISDITKEYEMLATQANYMASVDAVDNGQRSVNNTQQVNENRSQTTSMPQKAKKRLNINLDDIEVVDSMGSKPGTAEPTPPEVSVQQPESSAQNVEATTSKVEKTENADIEEPLAQEDTENSEVDVQNIKTESKQETTKVEVENSDETEDALINEMTLPRNVLSMFKPMFQQVLNGSKTLSQLEAYGKIITDERAKVWFKQQLKQLAEKL